MGLGIVVAVVITGVGLLAAAFVLNRDLEDI